MGGFFDRGRASSAGLKTRVPFALAAGLRDAGVDAPAATLAAPPTGQEVMVCFFDRGRASSAGLKTRVRFALAAGLGDAGFDAAAATVATPPSSSVTAISARVPSRVGSIALS